MKIIIFFQQVPHPKKRDFEENSGFRGHFFLFLGFESKIHHAGELILRRLFRDSRFTVFTFRWVNLGDQKVLSTS